MAVPLIQVTLPHRDQAGTSFERRNGTFWLRITSTQGLPWGKYARLIICWLTTEAVRTRTPTIRLGESLSDFITDLGLSSTGGRSGTICRVREQAQRLFSSRILWHAGDEGSGGEGILSGEWGAPWQPQSKVRFGEQIHLSERFFSSAISRPVPIDLRVLRVLRSPLALDIYCWLTHRATYLRKETEIPWPVLARQFGAGYAELRAFRHHFLRQSESVLRVYPAARLSQGPARGLLISPAETHVPRR